PGMRTHRDRIPQLLRSILRSRGEHGDAAAVFADDPNRFLHGALLVRADREPEVTRVDIGAVLGQYDLRTGGRDSFHTDRDFHWSLLSRGGTCTVPAVTPSSVRCPDRTRECCPPWPPWRDTAPPCTPRAIRCHPWRNRAAGRPSAGTHPTTAPNRHWSHRSRVHARRRAAPLPGSTPVSAPAGNGAFPRSCGRRPA